MINLYVKFNVHFSYAKQVLVLKVADERTDAPDDDNRHPPKFWLRPKNPGSGLRHVCHIGERERKTSASVYVALNLHLSKLAVQTMHQRGLCVLYDREHLDNTNSIIKHWEQIGVVVSHQAIRSFSPQVGSIISTTTICAPWNMHNHSTAFIFLIPARSQFL